MHRSLFAASRRRRLAAWVCLGMLSGPATAGSHASDAPKEEIRFDIWEYQVAGNSLLDEREIERAVYPHLGPGRGFPDVQAAQTALQNLYREAGFGAVLVTIPEQDVDQGIVQLQITESRVDRLQVSGAKYFSPNQIKRAVPSVAPGSIPNLPQLQSEMLALNRASPDRRITPVLRPGRTPGTLEVDLKVDDSFPVHGTFEVNDRFTRDTTRTRASATLSYGNLWQKQHSASVGYQTAPEDKQDVEVWFGTYLFRMSEWLVSAYAVKSDSDVATLGTLGVVGSGQLGGVRFIRPLGSEGSGFHTLTLGGDYKDFDESIRLIGGDPDVETPIRYLTATARYDLSFSGDARTTRYGIEVVAAPRLDVNEQEDFSTENPLRPGKRSGSRNNFAYLGFNFGHDRELWWDTAVSVNIAGQIADSPLISNEQFSFGGVETVRGYLESQQFVDNGLYGQFELFSPDLGRELLGQWLSARALTFVDLGGGSIKEPALEQTERFFLWSAGAGLRLSLWKKLTAALDWAYPLASTDDRTVLRGDDRWHFNLRFEF